MSGIYILQAAQFQQSELWLNLDWKRCHDVVTSLQNRIVKSVRNGEWRKAKRLCYLLPHSFSARTLAVKKVTENKGRKTAGIDGKVWTTPGQKIRAVEMIANWKGYQPKALKRIRIPKKDKTQKRPLSIPTMEDRARQALHLFALQPIAETQGDFNSYGFRRKRRCADAIEQIFKVLRHKTSAQWVLEGDIKGFFDNIDFKWLLENIPMNKKVLKAWLNCGFMEGGKWFPTKDGVPQGGIISPVIGRRDGALGKIQIQPSKTSIQSIKDKIKALCKSSGQLTQAQLIERLNPVLRGWANYHRHSICGDTFSQLSSYVWFRLMRWGKRRHPEKSGIWIAKRYFGHAKGSTWAFMDKATGKTLIRLNNDIQTFPHIKIMGDANPFDAEWKGYFRKRELLIKMKSVSHYIGKISKQQNGRCLQCGQLIQAEDKHHLHYIDGDKTHRRVKNVLMIHKTCKKAFDFIRSKHVSGASIDRGVCNA